MKHMMRVLFLLMCLSVGTFAFGGEWNTVGLGEIVGCYAHERGCLAHTKTRYGELSVERTDDETFGVLLNNIQVATFEGFSVNIQEKFVIEKSDIYLVALNSGGMACPIEYYVIQINDASTSVVSSSFGTCTDSYKATVEDGALLVRMPSYFNPMHTNDLSKKELKEIEKRKGTVFRWFNSKLSEMPDIK